MFIDDLRSLNLERTTDVDDLMAAAAFAKLVVAEYSAIGVHPPQWIEDRGNEIRAEIKTRLNDIREKRKREIKAQLQKLRTKDEIKSDLERELTALEQL